MNITELNKKYNCKLYIIEFEESQNNDFIVVENPMSFIKDKSEKSEIYKIKNVIPVDGTNAWEVSQKEFEEIEEENTFAPPNGCIGISFSTATGVINSENIYAVWNPINCRTIDLEDLC